MKKFNLVYKPINFMKFPDLKKKILKYEKISHNNLNKFNIYNDKILDKYYKYLENNEKMNDDEVNNNEQVNKSIAKDDNESNYEEDDILLPMLKFGKEKNNQDNKNLKTFSFNKSLIQLKNTLFDKNINDKHNRRTLISLYKNKYNLDNNNDNNISDNFHKKSLILNNHYNFDNNISDYKNKISKTNKINIINNLNNYINTNNTNNTTNTNKTINNTNYLSKETFLNNTRSSNNSETKKTLKKNSNKYVLYLKKFDNEDENSSEKDEIENYSNKKNSMNYKNHPLNYTSNNYYKSTINNLCKTINKNCNKMNNEINNKPKFKFVTQKEIKNEVTKNDLDLNKTKNRERNGFKNMKIFNEIKAISKISYNLSYRANKFILNNLEKKKKNKYNFNFKESTEDYKNTRKKFFKKAFELLENSQIEKKKCMDL